MTEAEWLASDDPGTMLEFLQAVKLPPGFRNHATPRKLRLFAVACHPGDNYWKEWGEGGYEIPGATTPLRAAEVCAGLSDPRYHQVSAADKVHRAGLLREIVGNPFRPPWMVVETAPPSPLRERRQWLLQSWLTPQVLSLVTAAYEERGRACDVCDGARAVREHRAGEVRGSVCPTCGDSGIMDEGLLDSFRLGLVADALEEAGCEGVCPGCKGEGRIKVVERPPVIEQWQRCDVFHRDVRGRTGGCDGRGWVTHPLVTHLRSPGPHVRGCWALDLVLGRD